jgi:hypothetical protein
MMPTTRLHCQALSVFRERIWMAIMTAHKTMPSQTLPTRHPKLANLRLLQTQTLDDLMSFRLIWITMIRPQTWRLRTTPHPVWMIRPNYCAGTIVSATCPLRTFASWPLGEKFLSDWPLAAFRNANLAFMAVPRSNHGDRKAKPRARSDSHQAWRMCISGSTQVPCSGIRWSKQRLFLPKTIQGGNHLRRPFQSTIVCLSTGINQRRGDFAGQESVRNARSFLWCLGNKLPCRQWSFCLTPVP